MVCGSGLPVRRGGSERSLQVLAPGLYVVQQREPGAIAGVQRPQFGHLAVETVEAVLGQTAFAAQALAAVIIPAPAFVVCQRRRPVARAIAEQQLRQARVAEPEVALPKQLRRG